MDSAALSVIRAFFMIRWAHDVDITLIIFVALCTTYFGYLVCFCIVWGVLNMRKKCKTLSEEGSCKIYF